MHRKMGNYIILSSTKYFIPNMLPPKDPPLNLDDESINLYGQAMLYLGKLNEFATRVPDIKRFIKAYITKEALLSSEIEGINTTMLDIYTQNISESKPDKSIQIVNNYYKALYRAVDMIQNKVPISNRVILSAHETLMESGVGDKSTQSNSRNYRKQAVKVEDLIPPPPQELPKLMSDLEQYINNQDKLPNLIKAGLVHVQFETIHPFADGNGRIGRLLIVLMLAESKILSQPIIYPSYYFKKYKLEYYQKLNRVRTHGDFEGWIKFYLMIIKNSATDAYYRAKEIDKLWKKLSDQFQKEPKKLQALDTLFIVPIINIPELSSQLSVSYNTTNKIISDFVKLGILVEIGHKVRGKIFQFKQYFDILQKEYLDN